LVNWKETVWRPDTCGCVVVYRFDHDLPLDSQSPDIVSVDPCLVHANLPPGLQGKFDIIYGDNFRKNDIYTRAAEALNLLDAEGFPDEGQLEVAGYTITWYFTGQGDSRVLHVVIDLNPGQTNKFQGLADSVYGVGKVVIENP